MRNISFDVPEIDYLQLMERLKGYAYPRDKVTKLLRSGELVRIRKGLYLSTTTSIPYSKEILANLIYGPSYVSLEYALQHHGLIPEAVRVITSVTTGRKKRYSTPVGIFDYAHLPERCFAPGSQYELVDSTRSYMIASPAKALFDTLFLRYPSVRFAEIEAHLFENMRIDEDEFSRIDFSGIEILLERCSRPSIHALRQLVQRRKQHGLKIGVRPQIST
jgi:predicted transcriptional regulator of viral defense system